MSDDVTRSRSFLGEELLTWLWFRSQLDDGRIAADDLDGVEVRIGDRIKLTNLFGEQQECALRGSDPGHSEEARTALRGGSRLVQAKLRLLRDEAAWELTLRASDLDLGSIKLPEVLKDDEGPRMAERLMLLEDLEDLLAALYRAFLQRRLDEDRWKAELKAMTEWLDS